MCVFLYLKCVQFDEQKDEVVVERILRVVFLDSQRSTPVSLNS